MNNMSCLIQPVRNIEDYESVSAFNKLQKARDLDVFVPSGQSLCDHITAQYVQHKEGSQIHSGYNFNDKDLSGLSDFIRLHTIKSCYNEIHFLLQRIQSKLRRLERDQRQYQNEVPDNRTNAIFTQCSEHETVNNISSKQKDYKQRQENGNENYSTPIRTSTKLFGPLSQTQNRQVFPNQFASHSDPERTQGNTEPLSNLENDALQMSGVTKHPSKPVCPVLPQIVRLSKKVKTSSGVPLMYRDRLNTFQGVSLPRHPDVLARNGFYYVGRSDAVKCADCGVVWHVTDNLHISDTVHTPDCKFHLIQGVPESSETSSQPNSLSDNDVSSLPAVQEVKELGFQTPDIVNAYREIASGILRELDVVIFFCQYLNTPVFVVFVIADFRCITNRDILINIFEDDKDGGIPDENETGCTCCDCLQEVMSEMYLPCRHGCCCDCKSRVLLHCPKCDAIIKSKIDIYT